MKYKNSGFAAVIAIATIVLGGPDSRAVEWCYDLAGGPAYDCSGPQPQHPAQKAAPVSLRDQLRRSLENGNAGTANTKANADQINKRITDATARANQALADANKTNDPNELQRIKKSYDKAMRDMDRAFDDAAKASSPDNRDGILEAKQRLDAAYADRADSAAWNQAAQPAQPAASAPSAETAQPDLPTFGDGDRRRAADVAAMSPECRAKLNGLLEGADKHDNEEALSGYIGLRADCEAQIRKLARDAEIALPERKLSERLQGIMAKAMSRNPDDVIAAVGDRGYDDGGSYDAQEVIEFGLSLLNLLGGVANVYAVSHGGIGAVGGVVRGAGSAPGPAHTYDQGGPAVPAPRGNSGGSDISGIGTH